MITLRKSHERGHISFGWLDTHHTFSFGDYYDGSVRQDAHIVLLRASESPTRRGSPPRGELRAHQHHLPL